MSATPSPCVPTAQAHRAALRRGDARRAASALASVALALAATTACGGKGARGDGLEPLGAQPGLEFGRLCTLVELCTDDAQPVGPCVAALHPTGPAGPAPEDDEPTPVKPRATSSDDPPPPDPCAIRAATWAACLSRQLELTCATAELPAACADHAARWPEDACGPAPALLHRLTTHD